MKRVWRILRLRVSDEMFVYLGVPLFGWVWFSSVRSCLELYRRGIDQPSVLDFVTPSIIFALWVFAVIGSWRCLHHCIRKRRAKVR